MEVRRGYDLMDLNKKLFTKLDHIKMSQGVSWKWLDCFNYGNYTGRFSYSKLCLVISCQCSMTSLCHSRILTTGKRIAIYIHVQVNVSRTYELQSESGACTIVQINGTLRQVIPNGVTEILIRNDQYLKYQFNHLKYKKSRYRACSAIRCCEAPQ